MSTPSTPPSSHGHVVVGFDGSPTSDQALLWAAEHAWASHRPLLLLHAVAPIPAQQGAWMIESGIATHELLESLDEAGRSLLDEAVEKVAWVRPDLDVDTRLVRGDARTALLEAAEDATLLVVGSRGRGPLKSLLLGSVSVAITRLAPCPVAVVREGRETGETGERRGILVATDGTVRSAATLEFAYRTASVTRQPLAVLHCAWDAASTRSWYWIPPDDPTLVDGRLRVAESTAGLAEKFPDVVTKVLLAQGLVESCVVDLAASYDVVVVGQHGHSILDTWGLGSVATQVVERARSVVVVVRT